jgi:hypothetical protein
MKAMISGPGFLAVALCGLVLAGCDSIKDVRSEPSTDLPPQKVVLQGTIRGIGSRRPITLQNNSDVAGARAFFGNFNEPVSPFSFGTVNAGSPYNITVKSQPFGKICAVSNGSGTAGAAGAAPITVDCVNDPAVERYPLTVDTSVGAGLPNFKVTLSTEDGVREMDATGLNTVTFEDAIFNSQLSLPVFGYKVSATTDETIGGTTTTHNCAFTRKTGGGFPPPQVFSIGGRNVDANDQSVLPTGPATVAVNSCEFTVTANVQYNGTPTQSMPTGGMQLALRNNLTGVDEQLLDVSSYGTTNLSFPTPVRSNAKAIYELVVSRQPAGHHCVVSGTVSFFSMIVNTVSGSSLTVPTGSAVLLIDPDNPQWWAFTGRNVRCRAIPAPANQLTGTYQVDRPLQAVDSTSTAAPARPRLFLTFFADGTFLNAVNHTRISTCSDLAMFPPSPPTTACDGPEDLGRVVSISLFNSNLNTSGGVVHGFYAYDPVAHTIAFTAFTASNINPSNFGLNGMPGYTTAGPPTAPVGAVTATNVVKTPPPASTLKLRFSGNRPGQSLGSPAGSTTQAEVWSMTEPDSRPGELTGTWVSTDHRRMFAYNDNEIFGIHIGVNGLPNLQDTCYILDESSTPAGGKFVRHSGSSGNCSPGGEGFGRDLPFFQFGGTTQSAPHEPPGLNSRLPGSRAQYDLRPTPPDTFSVTPGIGGAPDVLTVQATQNNGDPDGQPVSFLRERAN